MDEQTHPPMTPARAPPLRQLPRTTPHHHY